MTSKKITRQDLRDAAEKYKNWGKWGADDEIGTLNYTSPEDIVAAARLVRKYGPKIKDVPGQRIRSGSFAEDILALVRAGESSTLEFKSTVRWNLKANRSGKEIELAWLKTVVGFMNTDGGTKQYKDNDLFPRCVGLVEDAVAMLEKYL